MKSEMKGFKNMQLVISNLIFLLQLREKETIVNENSLQDHIGINPLHNDQKISIGPMLFSISHLSLKITAYEYLLCK